MGLSLLRLEGRRRAIPLSSHLRRGLRRGLLPDNFLPIGKLTVRLHVARIVLAERLCLP